jgi:hypothetical protein
MALRRRHIPEIIKMKEARKVEFINTIFHRIIFLSLVHVALVSLPIKVEY